MKTIRMSSNVVRNVAFGFLVLAFAGVDAQAAQGEQKDMRIRLLVSTVETPDTRTDKFQEIVTLPPKTVPYSDAEIQGMAGDAMEQAQQENASALRAYNALSASVFLNEYLRRVKLQDEVARKAKDTKVGRNLILMRDWFAGSLGAYTDIFLCVFRVDDQAAQQEKFFTDMDALDVEKSVYFVKLVVNDPQQSTKTIRTNGGNTLTKTSLSQLITVHVQDLRNVMAFTKNVEVSEDSGSSSVVITGGSDDALGKVLRKCLDEVAKEMAEHFSVKLTLKLKGPKGDAEFDPDDATVTLDGKEVSLDEPITCAKTKHTVKVEMEGYETLTRIFDFSDEKGAVAKTLTLKQKKAEETKE